MRQAVRHLYNRKVALCPTRRPVALDQVCCPANRLHGEEVLDRFGDEAILLEPGGSPNMQERNQIGLGLVKPGFEQIGKQVVVTEPDAPIIQRNQKQVFPLQVF